MLGTAVGQVVTVDRGDDNMLQAELGDRETDIFRLHRIEAARTAGGDVAEGAGPRTGIAHDHEGGVLLCPAFADIRAAGLFTYGVKAVLPDNVARLEIAPRDRSQIGRASCRERVFLYG